MAFADTFKALSDPARRDILEIYWPCMGRSRVWGKGKENVKIHWKEIVGLDTDSAGNVHVGLRVEHTVLWGCGQSAGGEDLRPDTECPGSG